MNMNIPSGGRYFFSLRTGIERRLGKTKQMAAVPHLLPCAAPRIYPCINSSETPRQLQFGG